jgi:hypothetical protein
MEPEEPAERSVEHPARQQVRGVLTNVGGQIRNPRTRDDLARVLNSVPRARYFRDAGMVEAAMYALNPAGYRFPAATSVRTPPTVGLRPGKVDVERRG